MDSALYTLQYLTPVAVITIFAGSNIAASCFLHQPSKHGQIAIRRKVFVCLLLGAIVTLIAQGIAHLAQSSAQLGYWASQNATVFILASVSNDSHQKTFDPTCYFEPFEDGLCLIF